MNNKSINLIEAFLMFYFSWEMFRYFFGIGNIPQKKEEQRVERVNKYGWFIVVVGGVLFICGTTLLLLTILA